MSTCPHLEYIVSTANDRGAQYLDEIIDYYIDTSCTRDDCFAILHEYGDRDLSTPEPDLTAGWDRVYRQLAYNALIGAARDALSKDKL